MASDPFGGLVATHPRLMATPAAIDRVETAIADSAVGQALKTKIIEKATELLPTPTVVWQPNLLDVSREALKRLQTLGMAWLLDGDSRYAARAALEIAAICGFPDWNPSHFLDTAEMTHAAAIGYDWFYSELSEADRAKCATAIVDLGLRPGLDQLTGNPDPAWPSRTTNWNIVCNTGLMIGALAVVDRFAEAGAEGKLIRHVFQRCVDSVPTGFHGYAPDGSWDEGPGYWIYATEYAAYLLASLKTALGHEFGLGDLPGLRDTGLFRMHVEGSAAATGQAGLLFNFSDSDNVHSGSWCMRWLALRYDRPQYNWVALTDAQTAPMDLLWFSSGTPNDGKGISRNAMFRGVANVAMLRGKWSSTGRSFRPWERHHLDTVYLAIRAGSNIKENHHGHLDLGSFALDVNQARWAVDLPPAAGAPPEFKADYDLPGYFDLDTEKRFTYYRTSTFGHNTLVVNGWNQPLEIATEIVGFGADRDLAVAVVDLTNAYPDCLRVRRGFALIARQHVLIVDEITPKQGIFLVWQMHTAAAMDISGVRAELTQADATSNTKKLYARILSPDGAAFDFRSAEVRQPHEAPNTGIRRLVIEMSDLAAPTRLAVSLSPTPAPVVLPPLLEGPLWTWIEWAGNHPHRNWVA